MNHSTHFTLADYFRPQVIKKYGPFAWHFLDQRLIHTMDWIREKRNCPILINHGTAQQRGFRDNQCPMVKEKNDLYLSPHCTGKGVDFNVVGETAEQTRQWLVEHQDELPYPIRLEHHFQGKPIDWVHLDLYNDGTKSKILFFNA